MSDVKDSIDHNPSNNRLSCHSANPLDKNTYHYYRFLYQNQNHMLVRVTKFFGRKSYRWFRLTDTELFLYSRKTSSQPKAVIALSNITYSPVNPILKGFNNCIMLILPKHPAFWLHFKNENEQFFFTSLLPNPMKNLGVPQVFVQNPTFNPTEYDKINHQLQLDFSPPQSNADLTKESDLRSHQNSFSPLLVQEFNIRREHFPEENLRSDIGQEENIIADKLRVYQEIYAKGKGAMLETSLVIKENTSQMKNHSTNFSDHDILKEDLISRLPDIKEKHKLVKGGTKETITMANIQMGMSVSTKEESYKFSKKASLTEKIPSHNHNNRAAVTSTCENEITTKGHLFTLPHSLVPAGEGEIDKDILDDETMGVWGARRMNFHSINEKNTSNNKTIDLSSGSPEHRPLKAFTTCTPINSMKKESNFSSVRGRARTIELVGSSRRSEKVIGPRVLMTVVGPPLKDDSGDEQGILSSILDEIQERKPKEQKEQINDKVDKRKSIKFMSSKQLNSRSGAEDKSNFSISLLDDGLTEPPTPQIRSVDECIKTGHRQMWNFELQDAKKTFKLWRGKSLLIELMMIESNLLQIATSGSERKIKKTLDLLQSVMNKANNLSFPQKDAPEEYFSNELHKAEICVFKGAMHFFLGNKFQTIKALAEGWRHYRKLEQSMHKKPFKDNLTKTSIHRLHFGYGCFNLVFSLIPQGLLKFMKLIGVVDANKEKGLESLEACRKEDSIRSNYCAIILSLYRIEFELALEKASVIMRDSLENYNKCPLFHWLTSIVCWKYAQAKDAYYLMKTALWQLRGAAKEAIYLIYELGWYHFLNMSWEKSLTIFQKVISNALPQQFFKNQTSEAQSLAKSLKLTFAINFQNFDEHLNAVKEERNCILPHLPHIAVKIAACHFHLEHFELAIKWLLSAYVINKNYSNFKSKQEEDFAKLAVKFLHRCSMKMLAFEVIYLMKYMPKMSDQNIMAILAYVEEYQNSLTIGKQQLEIYLSSNSKEDPFIVEYFSATLIKIVSYCLMGDTDIAWQIYKKISKFLCLLPEDASYMIYHIEYWVARALISEEQPEEAKNMLKTLLKRKKCEFSMNTRIRNVLAELN